MIRGVSTAKRSDGWRAAGAARGDGSLAGEREESGPAQLFQRGSCEEDRERQLGGAAPQVMETARTDGARFVIGRLEMDGSRGMQGGSRVGPAPAPPQTVTMRLPWSVQIQGADHEGDRQENGSGSPVHTESTLCVFIMP